MRKGVSGVVTAVILVLIVLLLVGIVYSVVIPMVKKNIEYTEACSLDIIGQIEINSIGTCYDAGEKELKVSISVKDIEMEEMIIVVNTESGSNTFPEEPEKESGKTYIYENFLEEPTSISVFPIINGHQCNELDSLNNIPTC